VKNKKCNTFKALASFIVDFRSKSQYAKVNIGYIFIMYMKKNNLPYDNIYQQPSCLNISVKMLVGFHFSLSSHILNNLCE
jgi:hypothetical protein